MKEFASAPLNFIKFNTKTVRATYAIFLTSHFSSVCNLQLNLCCREVNEDFLEFECHLKLDFDVLRGSGVPYKYCVYETNYADEFEYLHGAPTQGWRDHISNRCLRVNNRPGKGKSYMILGIV